MRDVPDLGPIRFRRRRDAGSALHATFAFLRRNARELAVSYLALVVPVLLAGAVATALWMSQAGDALFDPSPDDPLAVFNGSYVGAVLFGLLGNALMQAAAAAYVRLYRGGEAGTITAGSLWDEAKGLVLPYVGMSLLLGLAVVLAGVVDVVPCLGAIAWAAFVVWLLPHYAVAVAARALEAESVAEAWTRAQSLVRGSWGFAFGTMLLAYLVLAVLYVAVSAVVVGVAAVAGANTLGLDPAALGTGLVLAPLQVVAGAFYLVPLVTAFFVHGRLVEDLEGTSLADGLDARAAGFDEPTSRPTSTPPAPPSRTDGADASSRTD